MIMNIFFSRINIIIQSKRLYLQGGILAPTTRILLMDMLTENLPVAIITGMVVLKAELVTDDSLCAFSIYLYREKNKCGFVRAISDEPQSFVTGFSRLEKAMKWLSVDDVSLWPR